MKLLLSKKNPMIYAAFWALLITLAVFLWYIWIYQGLCYSYSDDEVFFEEYEYDEMYEDADVVQSFVPRAHYLKGLYLYMINIPRDATGDIRIELRDKNSELLSETNMPLEDWAVDYWNYFECEKRLSPNREYELRISIADQSSDISPYLLRIPNPEPNSLTQVNSDSYIGSEQSVAIRFRYANEASDYEKLAISSFAFLLFVMILYYMNDDELKGKYCGVVAVAFLFVQFAFYVPNIAYKLQYINLDDSWRYFLNVAGHEGYVFGKDVFFTYGPLGYLCYMMNLPDNGKWFALGVAIWVVVVLVYIFLLIKLFMLYKKGAVSLLSIITSSVLAVGSYIVLERDNFLLYLLILSTSIYMLENRERNDHNIIAYVISCVLLTLMFFAKFSTFTSGFAFLTLFVMYETVVLKKLKSIWLIIPSLLTMPLGYLLYNPSLTNLRDYIVGIVKISSGWMETQQFDFTVFGNDLRALVIIISSFIVMLVIMFISQYKNASIALACSASMFFVYKYATTRHGLPCGIWLFGMIYAIIPLTIDFKRFKQSNKIGRLLGCTLSLCIVLIGIFQANTVHNSFGKLKESFASKAYNWTHLNQLGIEETVITDYESEVSDSILELIGDETVCVYPWRTAMKSRYPEMNVVYYPSVQNVNEYIPWIDEKTAGWFDSTNAPKFILLKDETIDGHIKYLDNPLTWQRIQKNYNLTFFDEKWCLLERKKSVTSAKELRLICEEFFVPGEVISVPDGAEYVKIYTEYDTWGKIKKFFYHVYGLNMRIAYEDGAEIIGKVMTPNLVSGFELCEYPQNESEFVMYMSGEKHKRIVQFTLCGLGAKDLENNARVEWYSYK